MRTRNIVLSGVLLGTLGAMAPAQTVPPPPPVSAPKCPVTAVDNPAESKIVPSLSAGRDELDASHYARAVANFRPLAESGNVEAQRLLGGLLLREGCNIPTDKQAGAAWLRKAAQKGDVPAEYMYGQALLHGNGTAQDDKAAFEWTERAAKAGDPQSEVGLGYLYFVGRGVKADVHEGLVWTVKAGEQGAPVALSNIAKSYLAGKGVPKDLHRAMFFIATAIQRVPPGQYQLSTRFGRTRYNIARQLSVEDVRSIEKDAEKWSPGQGSLASVLTDAGKGAPAPRGGGVKHDVEDL